MLGVGEKCEGRDWQKRLCQEFIYVDLEAITPCHCATIEYSIQSCTQSPMSAVLRIHVIPGPHNASTKSQD